MEGQESIITEEKKGLNIPRYFTKEGVNPFDMFTYEKRSSTIKNPDGSIVFNMDEVEVPNTWSQVATDILAQKYFRKAGVPLHNERGELLLDENGKIISGSETSIKQVAHRIAGCWRHWGEKYGYFSSAKDAQIFYEEMLYMITGQLAAPNSPQWFTTGLNWAYGITGPAQGHSFVDPVTKKLEYSKDAYTRSQPHACAEYFTQLFTEDGTKYIGNIVEEDLVGLKVFDGEKFVKILATKYNGEKEVHRIKLKNGNYIDLTEDHLVLSAEKRSENGGKYQWNEVKDLLIGHKLQQPLLLDLKEKNVFNHQLARARLAGWVVGDGSVGIYNNVMRMEVITVNNCEHESVLNDVKAVFGDDVTYWVTNFATKNDHLEGRRIHLSGKKIHNFVDEFNLLNSRSTTARVPFKITYGSPQEKREFLKTLFQADGCVRIRVDETRNSGDVCLTTSSESLSFEVLQLLNSLGIYSRISKNIDSRENRIGTNQIIIAYGSARQQYQEQIGFVSEEKQQKLVLLNKLVQRSKSLPLIREESIVSIETIGVKKVYDIQTESGKFLGNGIVVHNCFIQDVTDDLVRDGGIFSLLTREARIFKYGSGTGSNFSKLRGKGEILSGGGSSSGLMSFLKIFDVAAGSIKSGGTTRRAAKMVSLDLDHPEIEDFIWWKVREEEKVASLVAGSKILKNKLSKLISSAQNKDNPLEDKEVRKVMKQAAQHNIPINYLVRALHLAKQGYDLPLREFDTHYESEAYLTVSGQNSNNSIRIPNTFFEALKEGKQWELRGRISGDVMETISAEKLWDDIGYCAWASADPGVQYDTTINEWHTCPEDGKINGSNPCVTGDTLVLTEGGRWKRIDTIIDKQTTILTNTGIIQEAPIFGSFKTGRKPVYKLETKYGYELKVTGDHKIFTVNRGFVQACELTKNDHVLLPAHEVSELNEVEDKTFYQMLGVYLGDGCGGNINSNRGIQITMSKQSEMSILNKFSEYVATTYDRITHKTSPAVVQVTQTSGKYVITNNTLLTKFMETVNVSLLGHQKCISEQIFGMTLGEQKYVLQGLFTADGTLANYGKKSQYVALDSTSLQLLKDVQILLLGFGIKSKIYKNRRAGKLTSLLPDGKGGIKEYDVKEIHSLRISRSSRIKFEQFVGFMPESPKNEKLKLMNEAVETYKDQPIDVVNSLEYIGEHDVYDLTEPLTSTFVANGITIHNCSEYMFLDDTACNLASINLGKFYQEESGTVDIKGYRHAIRLWSVALEISVLMAQFPSEKIAERSFQFRTLGLGFANIGTLLMLQSIPYDSDEGRTTASALTAILTGDAYATSAEMAEIQGPFEHYEKNKQHMLRVIRNHRRAAYNHQDYEGITIPPPAINQELCPNYILEAAHDSWNKALELGEKFGYRNAQATVLAPTGTIGLVMDCDTTGVEPEYALVKHKKLAGGGFFKIVNNSVPKALRKLGYSYEQVEDIVNYCIGHGKFEGSPYINRESLIAKGFNDEQLANLSRELRNAMDIRFVFNSSTVGEVFYNTKMAGKTDDFLGNLGFTNSEITAANKYICGTMMLEGAPHLKEEHYPVFDCANKCGKEGTRYIHPYGHLKMLAATQSFISGAISKTINMPQEWTVEQIKKAYHDAWAMSIKATALYRDGCKLSQPLNTTLGDNPELKKILEEEEIPETNFNEIRKQVSLGNKELILTGKMEEGKLTTVSLQMGGVTPVQEAMMVALINTVNLNLQNGITPSTIAQQSLNVEGHPVVRELGAFLHELEGSNSNVSTPSVAVEPTRLGLNESERQKCRSCGATQLRQNGTCMLCEVCGETTGCS